MPSNGNFSYQLENATIHPIEENPCLNDEDMPDFFTYTEALGVYGTVLFTYGAGTVLVVLFMYFDTLIYVMKNSYSRFKTPTAIIISVYPVVVVVTYCAILVPRAYIIAESTTQAMFMCSVYQLFRLYVAYSGGEAELIRKLSPAKFNPKVPPCCCWPCCVCLPRLSLNKKNVTLLRVLIIQLPVVQGLLYMTHLVMWAEKQRSYHVNFAYVQPFILLTIITGIWAMRMFANLLKEMLPTHDLTSKMLALQLVPLSSQFFGLLLRILVMTDVLPCSPPITVTVYASLVYNSIMMTEMIILGLWSRSLYKRIIPDINIPLTAVQQSLLIENCVRESTV